MLSYLGYVAAVHQTQNKLELVIIKQNVSVVNDKKPHGIMRFKSHFTVILQMSKHFCNLCYIGAIYNPVYRIS